MSRAWRQPARASASFQSESRPGCCKIVGGKPPRSSHLMSSVERSSIWSQSLAAYAASNWSQVAWGSIASSFRQIVIDEGLLHSARHEMHIAITGRAPVGKSAQVLGTKPLLEGFNGFGRIARLDTVH